MSLTQAVMSCLLIVSWVIEVEYTLTAIPQLQQKKQQHFKTEAMQWLKRYRFLMRSVSDFRDTMNKHNSQFMCILEQAHTSTHKIKDINGTHTYPLKRPIDNDWNNSTRPVVSFWCLISNSIKSRNITFSKHTSGIWSVHQHGYQQQPTPCRCMPQVLMSPLHCELTSYSLMCDPWIQCTLCHARLDRWHKVVKAL